MSLPRLQWTDGDRTTRIDDCRMDGATDRAPVGSVAAIRIEDHELTGDHSRKKCEEVTSYMTRDELAALHAWAGTMLKTKGSRGYLA
jgi:hypothetical protein